MRSEGHGISSVGSTKKYPLVDRLTAMDAGCRAVDFYVSSGSGCIMFLGCTSVCVCVHSPTLPILQCCRLCHANWLTVSTLSGHFRRPIIAVVSLFTDLSVLVSVELEDKFVEYNRRIHTGSK